MVFVRWTLSLRNVTLTIWWLSKPRCVNNATRWPVCVTVPLMTRSYKNFRPLLTNRTSTCLRCSTISTSANRFEPLKKHSPSSSRLKMKHSSTKMVRHRHTIRMARKSYLSIHSQSRTSTNSRKHVVAICLSFLTTLWPHCYNASGTWSTR